MPTHEHHKARQNQCRKIHTGNKIAVRHDLLTLYRIFYYHISPKSTHADTAHGDIKKNIGNKTK